MSTPYFLESLYAWPASLWNMAPQNLVQPLNPGWSFGNVIVNATNSSSPEIESRVVSQHSYGRQLGRMMDAMEALIDAVPSVQEAPEVTALKALADEIRRLKSESLDDRIARLEQELRSLKASRGADRQY